MAAYLLHEAPAWRQQYMEPGARRFSDLVVSSVQSFVLLVHASFERLFGIHLDSDQLVSTILQPMYQLSARLGVGQCIAFYLSVLSVNAGVDYEPALPPSYPLAVRNPYLSTWIPGSLVESLPTSTPQFWTGQDLTWSIIGRVDGKAYSLMGVANSENTTIPAQVQKAEYTTTHSMFTLNAGPVTFTLDFLSPVSPSNYLRQSLPFSYLTVSVSSPGSHDIQIYSDIGDEWTGSTDTEQNFRTQEATSVFTLTAENAATYTEIDDMALWGEVVFASKPSLSSNLSAFYGPANTARSDFARHGTFTVPQSQWNPGEVVALSHSLGRVTGSQSVTYAVGYVREKAINYLGEAYTGYYRSKYPTTAEAVSYFLDDYAGAPSESIELDSKLSAKATAVAGQKYSDIVTLSVRQAYAGIDLTIPYDTLDTSDPLAFIKEISSDGNVNTVDIIMPAFPIYYVMDPDYIRLLLEPVMRYMAAGRWHLPYVIHDIGSSYPNATGHDDQLAEPMPIEETGNLMILTYAYTKATGDTQWAAQYTGMLQKYADYLVDNSINIANQLSTNDAAGPLPNETNLAIKAAVGLKAFGKLSGLTNYSDIGDEHAKIFYTDGLGTDPNRTHFVLEYPDMPSTWKTPYNLYPDVLLDLETFPTSAYAMGSKFFQTVRGEYGVALDNRQDWAKSDWNMWLAGTFGTTTRDQFVDDLWAFMTNGLNAWPFSDRYISTSAQGNKPGVGVLCKARPTVGGHLALLALEGPGSVSLSALSTRSATADAEDLNTAGLKTEDL
ncbi:hypothetical protein DTO271D3_3950 [Paecilomyces variotii]|nr:hypothetical protein DTO271D3_3950 [Paecilomyces variotii]